MTNITSSSGTSYKSDLSAEVAYASRACLPAGSTAHVDVVDLHSDSKGNSFTIDYGIDLSVHEGSYIEESHCTNEEDLKMLWTKEGTTGPSTRFFFCQQRNAMHPLSITFAMLKAIVDRQEMDHSIYEIVRWFQPRGEFTASGYCGPLQVKQTTTARLVCYIYKYAAKKAGNYTFPWVIRQTGIIHIYQHASNQSIWFIMNSNAAFDAKERIWQSLQDSNERISIATHSLWLHSLLLTSQLTSWWEYCAYYESIIERINENVATTELSSPQCLDHGLTLRMSELEKRFLPLASIFKSAGRLVDGLRHMSRPMIGEHDQIATTFTNLKEQIAAHTQSSSYILDFIRSVRQQISDTLSLKNQQVAQDTSDGVATLTQHTAKDSRAVRNITIVTLFYLPFTFVSTFMGMNFFVMDTDSREVMVSQRLWVYFLIAVPLTGMTIMLVRRDLLRAALERLRLGSTREEDHAHGFDLPQLSGQ